MEVSLSKREIWDEREDPCEKPHAGSLERRRSLNTAQHPYCTSLLHISAMCIYNNIHVTISDISRKNRKGGRRFLNTAQHPCTYLLHISFAHLCHVFKTTSEM